MKPSLVTRTFYCIEFATSIMSKFDFTFSLDVWRACYQQEQKDKIRVKPQDQLQWNSNSHVPRAFCETCGQTFDLEALLKYKQTFPEFQACPCGEQTKLIKIQTHTGPLVTSMDFVFQPRLENVGRIYGPHNPGPLNLLQGPDGKCIADSFSGGLYACQTPKPGTFLLLLRHQPEVDESEHQDPNGSFFHTMAQLRGDTRHPFHSLRHELSVPHEWNAMEWQTFILVPPGGEVYTGITAPQPSSITWGRRSETKSFEKNHVTNFDYAKKLGLMRSFQGGAIQYYIPKEAVEKFAQATKCLLARNLVRNDAGFWTRKQQKYFARTGGKEGISLQREWKYNTCQELKHVMQMKESEIAAQKILFQIEREYTTLRKEYSQLRYSTISTRLESMMDRINTGLKHLAKSKRSYLWYDLQDMYSKLKAQFELNQEKENYDTTTFLRGEEPKWLIEAKWRRDGKDWIASGNLVDQIQSEDVKRLLKHGGSKFQTRANDKEEFVDNISGTYKIHEEEMDGQVRTLTITLNYLYSKRSGNVITHYFLLTRTWTTGKR